ncbi:hypothetical protein PSH25_005936, partial [Micromonospora sp. PSH25]|nr:hypothetical protein [Micromonospora foliorum]
DDSGSGWVGPVGGGDGPTGGGGPLGAVHPRPIGGPPSNAPAKVTQPASEPPGDRRGDADEPAGPTASGSTPDPAPTVPVPPRQVSRSSTEVAAP